MINNAKSLYYLQGSGSIKGKTKKGVPAHADTPCCNECILMITYCALKMTKCNVKY